MILSLQHRDIRDARVIEFGIEPLQTNPVVELFQDGLKVVATEFKPFLDGKSEKVRSGSRIYSIGVR
jgi:hypothetical protein